MHVHRQDDVMVLADEAGVRLKRWGFAAIFLALAVLAARGASSTGWWAWALAIFCGLLGVAALAAPTVRAEIDGKAREVRVFSSWPWGRIKTRVVGFAEVETVALAVTDLEDGRTYAPVLRLRSGRGLRLVTDGTRDERHALAAQRALQEVILGVASTGPAG